MDQAELTKLIDRAESMPDFPGTAIKSLAVAMRAIQAENEALKVRVTALERITSALNSRTASLMRIG